MHCRILIHLDDTDGEEYCKKAIGKQESQIVLKSKKVGEDYFIIKCMIHLNHDESEVVQIMQ
jgi:hypothetical protein